VTRFVLDIRITTLATAVLLFRREYLSHLFKVSSEKKNAFAIPLLD
jgi:hypothetical protein